MIFKEPSEYWQLAREHILKVEAQLFTEDKYYVDRDVAMRCIKFASITKLTAGEFGGKLFMFQQWQIEAIVEIFGVKHKHGEFKGLRRYQKALMFTPKKSGKTAFSAVLTAIYFFLDDEIAKECYTISSELEQAKILHKAFITIINQEPELRDMVHITKQPPKVSKMNGAFEDTYTALSATADSKDGLNVSMLLVDEPHTFSSPDLYDIMSNGQAGRKQPLTIFTSTAGFHMQGFFYRDIYQYVKKLSQGIIKDDSFWYVLFEPTEEDLLIPNYYKDRGVIARCNPNFPISPTWSYLESRIVQAEQSEASMVSYLTKHMNIWCDKEDIWISTKVWSANQTPIDEEALRGKTCYAGLDLASTTDIAALVLVFPDEDRGYDIVTRFWIPKNNMRERVRRDRVPYLDWVKQGLITATDGNVIDYSHIERDIKDLSEKFNIRTIAYDRWNASSLVTNLTDNGVVELIPFGQGFASMSAPTKQIEVLSLQDRLNHGNNEVLNWMISNVVLRRDPADNFKIDKSKSIEKVDGVVALAMALGMVLADEKEEDNTSVYETKDLIDL